MPAFAVEAADLERGAVRPRFCGEAVQPKVGPQRRANEAHALDRHRCGVQQCDPVHRALRGEDVACFVDIGAVVLVIAVAVRWVGVIRLFVLP